MHVVSTASVPINILKLFTKLSSVHSNSYNTRSSTSDNFLHKTLTKTWTKKIVDFKNWW